MKGSVENVVRFAVALPEHAPQVINDLPFGACAVMSLDNIVNQLGAGFDSFALDGADDFDPVVIPAIIFM